MAEKTRLVPLSAEQEKWYAAACERLNPERLQKLLLNLIDIHSPTGAERLASAAGINAHQDARASEIPTNMPIAAA